jgi:signal transduction histidine kinase
VLGYIDTLDATIRGIRDTIYRLHSTAHERPALRKRLLGVVTEQTSSTDLTTRIDFTGPVDLLPEELGDDVTAVLREALSNTVRHADAGTVDVQITLTEEQLTLQVIDDGKGIGQPTRSSGLTNMRRRAETHRGTLRHDTPPGGGTHLTWTARIPNPTLTQVPIPTVRESDS